MRMIGTRILALTMIGSCLVGDVSAYTGMPKAPVPPPGAMHSLSETPLTPPEQPQRRRESWRDEESHAAPKVPVQAQIPPYFHPGLLAPIGGSWTGGDHLFNLTHQIAVYVEIVKPDIDIVGISDESIKQKISTIFTDGGITPKTMVESSDAPPLPFFQVEILLYPIEGGYVASLQGRLFESVTLSRFQMDKGTAFQAITWEKQSLLVTPKNTAVELLEKNASEIAQAFVDRFRVYDRQRPAAPSVERYR